MFIKARVRIYIYIYENILLNVHEPVPKYRLRTIIYCIYNYTILFIYVFIFI